MPSRRAGDGTTADPSIGVWCRRANGRTRWRANFPDAEVKKRQSASEQLDFDGENPSPFAVRPINFSGHIGVRLECPGVTFAQHEQASESGYSNAAALLHQLQTGFEAM